MSAVMVDSFRTQQMPHRKPVGHLVPSALSQSVQTHSRSSSAASSTAYSSAGQTGYPQGPYANTGGQQPMTAAYTQPARRTLSNATTSTSSTSGSGSNKGAPVAHPPGLQRTASNRSGTSFASQNSYVALMRKQKATVWCDRAQLEDPRLVVQRRAAKQRAAAEMAGSVHSVRLLSNAAKMRSKVRHHGAHKSAIYQPGNLSGSAIPMRLSASEVDEGDSEEFETASQSGVKSTSIHHHRTGSGRSSIGSGRKMYTMPAHGRLSNASNASPSLSGHANSPSINSVRSESVGETPVPADYASSAQPNEYFVPATTIKPSTDSTSSSSRENSFGALGQAPQRNSIQEEQRFASDELRRRGSVDDRTMTLSAVRLFVANPDLSD